MIGRIIMIIEYSIESHNRYRRCYENKIIVMGQFASFAQWQKSASVDSSYGRLWTFIRIVKK
jgi:hypothetical protein